MIGFFTGGSMMKQLITGIKIENQKNRVMSVEIGKWVMNNTVSELFMNNKRNK